MTQTGSNVPKLEVGDIAIVTEWNHSQGWPKNQRVRVVSRNTNYKSYVVTKDDDSSGTTIIFESGPGDVWILASKENIIESYKNRIEEINKQIETLIMKVDFYEKYNNKDEYIAAKVDEIVARKGNTLEIIKTIKAAEKLPI